MKELHLHIISFTVPYPVDYGGVFDLYYKLEALQAQGVHIHLHCFDYGRGSQPQLNRYCAEVHYYHRNTHWTKFFSSTPWIVATRQEETLFNRLLEDDFPILCEGAHSSSLLKDSRFRDRKIFVRICNVEHEYYRQLSRNTSHPAKKLFYLLESVKLKRYEKFMAKAPTALWSLTEKDADIFRRKLGCPLIDYLPLFLPAWKNRPESGTGTFCLYHGDLSVEDNQQAAKWLLTRVFSKTKTPFVLAGKNPPEWLENMAHEQQHTCLVANPGEIEMQELIRKAHLNILPCFNPSGIKLKLINALYNGRHCLVNTPMLEGAGTVMGCELANTPEEFISAVEKLYLQPFDEERLRSREVILHKIFNNERNARQLKEWIFVNPRHYIS